MKDGVRARYTLEFKQEAVRLVRGGEKLSAQSLDNWVKVERLHGMRFGTRRQAKDEVMDWIAFYNHRRLRSTLGYTSPMALKQKWLAGQVSLAA